MCNTPMMHYIMQILFTRMYPVVPMNARLLTENDVIIGGYYFPKKVSLFI